MNGEWEWMGMNGDQLLPIDPWRGWIKDEWGIHPLFIPARDEWVKVDPHSSPFIPIHPHSPFIWHVLICGQRYAKRSLMSWVYVIPKEGPVHVATPALLLVWHWLFKKKKKKKIKRNTISKKFKKSVSYQKKDVSFFWYDNDSGHKGPFRVTPPMWWKYWKKKAHGSRFNDLKVPKTKIHFILWRGKIHIVQTYRGGWQFLTWF